MNHCKNYNDYNPDCARCRREMTPQCDQYELAAAPSPPPETEWTENDECHAALGYVAAELARLTGRGTHEVMNKARKVVREENARIVPVPIAPPRREP